MNEKQTYSISDLSRHFDLTPRAIRFYESEGLLNPLRENSKRIYRERDLVRLKLILRGKRMGFSLAEIKTTMELYDNHPDEVAQLEYVLETINSHRDGLLQKQQDISKTLEEMDNVARDVKEKLETLRNNAT